MADSIGKPMNRVDGPLKVSGRAHYAYEYPVENVAHGVLIMSTLAKGRIAAMDTSASDRAPGLLAVMTPFNTRKLPQKPKGQETSRPTNRKLQLLQDEL